MEALVLSCGNFQSTIQKAASYLRRHGIGDRSVARGHLAGPVFKHAFKDAERGIDNDFVILQKLNEGLHLFGFWIDLCAVGGNFSKASRGASVFYLGDEIKEDEIHVLNFIHAFS